MKRAAQSAGAAVLAGVLLAWIFSACGCGFAADAGGTLTEYTACPLGVFECGHVFMCEAPADNELGRVELCIDDDDHPEQLTAIELLYGACVPTPRHEGLCRYGCEPHKGCNAKSGCFCP